jgi:hypothetical protein
LLAPWTFHTAGAAHEAIWFARVVGLIAIFADLLAARARRRTGRRDDGHALRPGPLGGTITPDRPSPAAGARRATRRPKKRSRSPCHWRHGLRSAPIRLRQGGLPAAARTDIGFRSAAAHRRDAATSRCRCRDGRSRAPGCPADRRCRAGPAGRSAMTRRCAPGRTVRRCARPPGPAAGRWRGR